jgi:2-methylcitrate dehydratase PrpD
MIDEIEGENPGATRALAHFITTLRGEDVPSDVRQMARLLLLDQLGCQVAGVQMPWSRNVYLALRPLSPTGPSTVVGYAERLAPDAAAFLNSAMGHSNESDDTHLKSPTHPGAVVIPAALAIAEVVGASGEELLTAIIVGYEVMLHISQSVSPGLITRGHHPPPAVGPFGAAAAAARLLGLNEEETLNALSIAGSHSAGLQEYTQTGGSVKRLHCAIPSQAGVRSALLARSGVTGPPTVLEGKRGFCRVFVDEPDLSWLTKGLGEHYLLTETSIKAYSCCHLIHQALDAIKDLRVERDFAADEVETITIYTQNPASIPHVGAIKDPVDVLAAQFSISFSVAMLLTGLNCGWWDYNDVNLTDPTLLDLSNRTDFILEDRINGSFVVGARVVVRLRDGSKLERTVEHAHGEPESPLTAEEVREKFLSLTVPVIGPDRAQDLISAVADIDALVDLVALGRSLGQ